MLNFYTPLENIRKPYVFLFSEGIEMQHWGQMGYSSYLNISFEPLLPCCLPGTPDLWARPRTPELEAGPP